MKMMDSLILDTNLLLLYIVGGVEGGRYICKSKRLTKFSVEDYEKVEIVMSYAKTVSVTPYIITEVSNLMDMSGVLHQMMMEEVKRVIQFLNPITVDLRTDTDGLFVSFGITDNSLINLVKNNVVFTDDLRLAPRLLEVNSLNVLLINNI